MSLWEFEATLVGYVNFHCGDGKGGDELDGDSFERLSQLVDEAVYGD